MTVPLSAAAQARKDALAASVALIEHVGVVQSAVTQLQALMTEAVTKYGIATDLTWQEMDKSRGLPPLVPVDKG